MLLRRIVAISVFFTVGSLPLFAQQLDEQIIEKKADSLLKRMTLEEKMGMIHANSAFTSGGVPRLGIPELVMSDGPHGVRQEKGRFWKHPIATLDSGTYLPTGVCLAATWNPELGYQFGSVLGSEAAFRGKDVQLGPGVNIIRTPLGGRNFEYMTEDPYLNAVMAVGYIKGVQDQGVSACVKHFIANNQEVKRNSIDVEMDERALREIYLPAFKAAVQEAHVNTVMGAYNKFRGEWCSHNAYLNDTILKGEWRFDGAVISDWGAVHDTWQALLNGTDIEMGTELDMGRDSNSYHRFFLADTALALVQAGKIPEALIDDKVKRILRVMLRTSVISKERKKSSYNTKQHHEVARKIAEDGIVLLKNEQQLLPLNKTKLKSIAVIGANATRKNALGGGSSQVKAFYEVTPLEGLAHLAGKVTLSFSQGYEISRGAKANEKLIAEAVAAAKKADVAVIFGGYTHGYDYTVWKDNQYDAEAFDKKDIYLPFGQEELIRAVASANSRTIVVFLGGGAIDMRGFADKVPAMVYAWYPGMEGGNAIAEVLFGEINPSGKLPMSFPEKLEDAPAHHFGEYPGDGKTVHYKEGFFVGYRFFDSYKLQPRYAFGYGLSYTSFSFADLTVNQRDSFVAVQFTVKNTGKLAGAEVAQVYVKDVEAALPRPEKELKAFKKIYLKPGESASIELLLARGAFQYYNAKEHQWVLEPGAFEILVGNASNHVVLKKKWTIK